MNWPPIFTFSQTYFQNSEKYFRFSEKYFRFPDKNILEILVKNDPLAFCWPFVGLVGQQKAKLGLLLAY